MAQNTSALSRSASASSRMPVVEFCAGYCYLVVCLFFFFSSRRRHTRWTGDWSSDVCSSDLGESDEQALRRELREELGLLAFELGPLLWRREHEFDFYDSPFRGQRDLCYLVRSERFDPAPQIDLAAEHVTEVRWWTVDELETTRSVFGPRRLPQLVRELLERGPPPAPFELGV